MTRMGGGVRPTSLLGGSEMLDEKEESTCHVETGPGRLVRVRDEVAEDEGAAWGALVAWAETAPGPARPELASARAVGSTSLTPSGLRAIG